MQAEYINALSKQYEFLTKHIEYHDSTIFRSLSIYFLFSGAFIAKMDLFSKQPYLSSALVFIIGAIFSLMLIRTAILLSDLKDQVDKVECLIYKDLEKKQFNSISEKYHGKGLWNATRTSIIGAILILLLTIFLMSFLLK